MRVRPQRLLLYLVTRQKDVERVLALPFAKGLKRPCFTGLEFNLILLLTGLFQLRKTSERRRQDGHMDRVIYLDS